MEEDDFAEAILTAGKRLGHVVMEPFVIHGGEVGRDIRVWRDLKENCTEETLDREAAESVSFLRELWG